MARLVQANQDNLAIGEGVYETGDQTKISDSEFERLTADGAFTRGLLTDLGTVPDDEGDEVYVQGSPVAAPAAMTSTTVAAADAAVAPATYDAAYVETLRALANETKADLNALRADVVALRGTVDTLLTALKGTGKPLE